MSTSRHSPAVDSYLLESARNYGNRVVADAVEQHGVIAVLSPFKKHRSANTGNEFAAGNQAVLQAVALKRGFEANQWASHRSVEMGGGSVKKGENGVRIIAVHQAYTLVDKLDDAKKPIVNPETGEVEQVKKYDGPKAFYPLTVYNLDQTEGFNPKRSEITPDAGEKLPVAVSSVWAAVRMPIPTISKGERIAYDIQSDQLEVPPLEAFKGARAGTNAAYQLATHLAMAAGHEKRLSIPDFYDPERYKDQEAMVTVATNTAGAFLLTNHCQRFDPQVIDATGIAEAKNFSQKLRDREVELHLAMAQAHELYRYMITPPAAAEGTKAV